ncbi:hypothetical protein B0H14DRAFT_3739670 [Mycena olivaceomarginata]|nr:hypothetical protein B0H14DRAFT_3739670 [Mycena olivaceomarginata]
MNNTVNEVDWVAQGKFWASVHPRVKRMAVEYFTIPQELEFELLPSPHLSIAKMLDFPLPLQNNIITATQPAQFFSINRPDITVTTNFKVTEDGGFTQAGDAELPDTAVEEEEGGDLRARSPDFFGYIFRGAAPGSSPTSPPVPDNVLSAIGVKSGSMSANPMDWAFFLANSFQAQFTRRLHRPMIAATSSVIFRLLCTPKSLVDAPMGRLNDADRDLNPRPNSRTRKHEAALSPVQRMPTELISLIFTFTQPPFATSDGLFKHPGRTMAPQCRVQPLAGHRPFPALSLGNDMSRFHSRLEAHLERSQQRAGTACSVSPALHCDRWETISFTGSAMLYYHLDSIRGNLSLLRAIDIRVRQEHCVPRGGSLTIFDSCPRLHEAFINPGRYGGDRRLAIDLPFSQLHRYSGSNSWANHAYVLRSNSSNLVDCVLHLIGSPALSESPILLPHLRRLSVSSTDLLELLDTPVLEELYSHDSVPLPRDFGPCAPAAEALRRGHPLRGSSGADPSFASHLFAILGVGSRPPKQDEDGHGVPASTLALCALSLCFVPDSDRSSAPAPVGQGALLGFVESQLGSLRSLEII